MNTKFNLKNIFRANSMQVLFYFFLDPDMDEAVKELCKILSNPGIGAKTKYSAIEYLLDLTGTQDGREFLSTCPELFKIMSNLVVENKQVIRQILHKAGSFKGQIPWKLRLELPRLSI